MAATRNVNKVILIGNLTRDPDVRYTPQGTAVANFTVATNRSWMVDGVQKDAVDFHSAVAWNKLAEVAGQILSKGTMVYVEGRLQTRNWTDEGGIKKYKTEINVEELIVLRNPRDKDSNVSDNDSQEYESDSSASNEEDINLDELLNDIEE